MDEVTQILVNIESGDPAAADALLPLVYDQLRRLAASELQRKPSGYTFQPTALVHEAYLRLVDQKHEPRWNHRGHFYAAAAPAMRRIIVDRARRKGAKKHGGDRQRIPMDTVELPEMPAEQDLIALDDALTQLAKDRPEIAQLVNLRYFAGLSMEETARAMDTSLRTAERNWTFARAWLLEAIRDNS